MKGKDSGEKVIWDQMRSSSGTPLHGPGSQSRATPKLLVWLILFVSLTYIVYTLKLVSHSRAACSDGDDIFSTPHHLTTKTTSLLTDDDVTQDTSTALVDRRAQILRLKSEPELEQTDVKHIVFGIAASAKLWAQRKNYIKLWYKPESMRGIVWLDGAVANQTRDGLPPIKISGDTSGFGYTNKQGHRSAIRISRIVSETLRLGLKDVRWFVMGDDDTVFITDNLVRVLRKYDHTQYYYIGSLSESHLQNIFFSYGMAYGGGGFAISYPLAKALSKMQDRCIQRYPGLYGSDDRMQACMAELGVPLTKELGFHQVCQTHSVPIISCRLFVTSIWLTLSFL